MTPRSGYTLPVFACAAAIAALRHLLSSPSSQTDRVITLNLLEPTQIVEIPIEQVARIGENQALAIARSDPGDNLDLTRNTPIWAMVELFPRFPDSEEEQIEIRGGEGVAKLIDEGGKAAIYRYAQRLLRENIQRCLPRDRGAICTFILPEGRQLAQRTSNAAFGAIEGLSLLGTTGISQPLSAPGQLEIFQEELALKASQFDELVFCVGENGLDLAQKLGIDRDRLVKTANWLGPLLVSAGALGAQSVLLLGYHGKLIKLAGSIFHTHHHLADARLEIFTAYCANLGLPTSFLQQVFSSKTTEDALQQLREFDAIEQGQWVERTYGAIAAAIDTRARDYIFKHSQERVQVGSVLFDRSRKIIVESPEGTALLRKMCYDSLNN
ncbi:MAG: cobalt-precorrin-5B (C(1))-methyltransferase CbiD [Cyanobacteriota bacterium]|nr:cobalt-precorrin-5B (C(1))-methyltransferase CbiD [Cyanobacteriota bacterium]